MGPHHPDAAFIRRNLSLALLKTGDLESSEAEAAMAVDDLRKGLGEDHPEVGHALGLLGDVQLASGRLDEAEATIRSSLQLFERAHGPDHVDIGLARHNLATAVEAQERYEEAEAIHRAALESWIRTRGPDHPSVATSSTAFGKLLLVRNKPEEARTHLERAWTVRQRPDLPPPLRGETAFLLAQAHAALDDRDRAMEFARAAVDAYVEAGPEHEEALAPVRAWLRKHP